MWEGQLAFISTPFFPKQRLDSITSGFAWDCLDIRDTGGGSILKSGQPVTSLQLTSAAIMNEGMSRFFREYLLLLDLERLKDRCQSCLLRTALCETYIFPFNFNFRFLN